ncbi:MAG: hypothetical protein U0610_19720 [bacterium]
MNQHPWRFFGIVVLDAIAFTILGYVGIQTLLVGLDGGFAERELLARMIAIASLLLLLELVWMFGHRAQRWPRRVLSSVLTVGAATMAWWVIPGLAFEMEPTKERSFRWLPLDWTRLPKLLEFLVRIDPVFVGLVAAIVLALVALVVWPRTRRKTPFAILAVSVGYFVALSISLAHVPNLGPVPLMAAWLVLLPLVDAPRGFARSLAGFAPLLLITLFFLGVYPGHRGAPETLAKLDFVRRLYPSSDERSAYERLFPRQLVHDPVGQALFLSYGPTSGWASGVMRLPLAAGAAAELLTIEGGMRSTELDPTTGMLVGVDAPRAEVNFFASAPFRRASSADLFGKGPVGDAISFWVDAAHERFYILAYERAVITEWQRATWTLGRSLDLHQAGVTRLHGGGLKLLHDARRDRLVALLGPVDARDHYALADIDRERLAVVRSLILPMGSTDMLLDANLGIVLVPEGYGDVIHEIDAATWEVRRTLEGPRAGCRNLAFDPARRIVYGLGWGTGVLEATDYGSGKVIARLGVGKKPGSLALSPDGARIWVGSALGILEIDADRWLSGSRRDGAAPARTPARS